MSHRYYLCAYRKQFFSYPSWVRLSKGSSDLRSPFKFALSKLGGNPQTDDEWEEQIKKHLIAGLCKLSSWKVNVCVIYADDGPAHYNDRILVKDILTHSHQSKTVEVSVVSQSDDLFSLIIQQEEIVKTTQNWYQSLGDVSLS